MEMPGLQKSPGDISHDRAIQEALEQFCNSPEQSYEQFLTNFTYLTPENVTRGQIPALRGERSTSVEMDRRERKSVDTDKTDFQSRGQQNQHSLTTDLEELVQDGSAAVGRLANEETVPSDHPVKFASCQDDMEPEEELLQTNQGVRVLPGEVVECLPVYTPSFCHHTLLELSSTTTGHRAHIPQTTAECQSETGEVVPFRLDEMFDYDNVLLSRKHPSQKRSSKSS